MATHKEKDNAMLRRLSRIERKCDIILCALGKCQRRERRDEVDDVIERLHKAARDLRSQSAYERDELKRRFRL